MKLYVTEYSQRQDHFHIAEMRESLLTNRRAMLNRQPMDYILIGVSETYEGAAEVVEESLIAMKESHCTQSAKLN
jgi:hypothetical protein